MKKYTVLRTDDAENDAENDLECYVACLVNQKRNPQAARNLLDDYDETILDT